MSDWTVTLSSSEICCRLLLSSVFIGLFAGAQHRLNNKKGGGEWPITETLTETLTQTVTHTGTSVISATLTQTQTQTQTQTSIGVTTSISVSTSTTVSTTTVVLPAPEPTGAPDQVSAVRLANDIVH